MKTINSFLIILLVSLLVNACNAPKTELFNGKNLDNWTVYIPGEDPTEPVFQVEDGMLLVSGVPNAYIRSNKTYENYQLHIEWRWVEEAKNSGILLHVSGKDTLWPNCIEAQLKAGNAGDIVLFGEGVGITVNDSTTIIKSGEKRYAVLDKFSESSENDPGKWNAYDITVDGDMIVLKVNGILQNRGEHSTITKGSIAIQSEGGPMQFRNIYLTKLDK